MKATIVVDAQKDFCEGGNLAVEGGNAVAERIAAFLENPAATGLIVFTKDWHTPGSDNGGHFSETPDFVDTWPAHCVAGTSGAALNAALSGWEKHHAMFLKGQQEPAYSGFQGTCDGLSLNTYLKSRGVTAVQVCGIAADYCVKATMEDARANGYSVELLTDLTVGIHKSGEEVAQEFYATV